MKHPGGSGSAGAGHSAKHTRSKKHHHGKAKHNPHGQKSAHHHTVKPKVHTVAHHPHHPRGLAVGDLLPVCSLEAVAMSLRLAGQPVSDDDVAGLWEAAGCRELSIAEALAAFGVVVPDGDAQRGEVGAEVVGEDDPSPSGLDGLELAAFECRVESCPAYARCLHGLFDGVAQLFDHRPVLPVWPERPRIIANDCNLILGIDLPAPHAVLATPRGWWSWGKLWSPWTTAVSEAWEVSWL